MPIAPGYPSHIHGHAQTLPLQRSCLRATRACLVCLADTQDPAVIAQTGLCCWRSGARPELDFKTPGDFLRGCMALLWTGQSHTTFEASMGGC